MRWSAVWRGRVQRWESRASVLPRKNAVLPHVAARRRRVRHARAPVRAARGGLGKGFEDMGLTQDDMDEIFMGDEEDETHASGSDGPAPDRSMRAPAKQRPSGRRMAKLTSFDDDDDDDDDDALNFQEDNFDGSRTLRRQSYDTDSSLDDDDDDDDDSDDDFIAGPDDDDASALPDDDPRILSKPGQGKVYFEPSDDEDEESDLKVPPKKRRPYSPQRAKLGGQIIVSGDRRLWGRVCSGCGGIIGEVYDAEGNDALMKAGSTRDLNLNWRKVSRTRDITKKACCARCDMLKEGDITTALRALKDIDPDVFRNQIRQLAAKPVFIIKVIDALDFDGSWINNLRDLIGKNPVILAVTKVDLLVDQRDVEGRLKLMRWCDGRMRLKGLNCLASFAVSGKTGFGVSELSEFILESIKGRNVYVVGYANAGKSTLINRLKDEIMSRTFYSGTQGYMRKMELGKTGVTISRLPGTTLKSVRIPCFKSHKHAIWDTPGIMVPRYEFPTLEDQRVALMQEEPARIVPMKFEMDPDSILVVDGNLAQLEIIPKDGRRQCSVVHVKWYSALTDDVQVLSLTDAMVRFPRTQPGDKVNRTTPRLIKEFTPERSMLGRGGVDADIVLHNLGFFAIWSSYPDFKVRLYGPGAVQPCVRPCIPIPDYSEQYGSDELPPRRSSVPRVQPTHDPYRPRAGFSRRDPLSDDFAGRGREPDDFARGDRRVNDYGGRAPNQDNFARRSPPDSTRQQRDARRDPRSDTRGNLRSDPRHDPLLDPRQPSRLDSTRGSGSNSPANMQARQGEEFEAFSRRDSRSYDMQRRPAGVDEYARPDRRPVDLTRRESPRDGRRGARADSNPGDAPPSQVKDSDKDSDGFVEGEVVRGDAEDRDERQGRREYLGKDIDISGEKQFEEMGERVGKVPRDSADGYQVGRREPQGRTPQPDQADQREENNYRTGQNGRTDGGRQAWEPRSGGGRVYEGGQDTRQPERFTTSEPRSNDGVRSSGQRLESEQYKGRQERGYDSERSGQAGRGAESFRGSNERSYEGRRSGDQWSGPDRFRGRQGRGYDNQSRRDAYSERGGSEARRDRGREDRRYDEVGIDQNGYGTRRYSGVEGGPRNEAGSSPESNGGREERGNEEGRRGVTRRNSDRYEPRVDGGRRRDEARLDAEGYESNGVRGRGSASGRSDRLDREGNAGGKPGSSEMGSRRPGAGRRIAGDEGYGRRPEGYSDRRYGQEERRQERDGSERGQRRMDGGERRMYDREAGGEYGRRQGEVGERGEGDGRRGARKQSASDEEWSSIGPEELGEMEASWDFE